MRHVTCWNAVGIPDPNRRLKEYPHQLSGGMRQRALIAMALACRPRLLIADEPTTALDVTIQAQILASVQDAGGRTRHRAMIMITHDLGVVAGLVDEVNVLYGGRVVERADRHELFDTRPGTPTPTVCSNPFPRLDAPAGERLTPINGLSRRTTSPGSSSCAFALHGAAERSIACREVSPGAGAARPNSAHHLLRCHNPVVPVATSGLSFATEPQ